MPPPTGTLHAQYGIARDPVKGDRGSAFDYVLAEFAQTRDPRGPLIGSLVLFLATFRFITPADLSQWGIPTSGRLCENGQLKIRIRARIHACRMALMTIQQQPRGGERMQPTPQAA